MYVPKAFAEEDPARIRAFLDTNDFAILVTMQDGSPFATHLPLLLDADRGPLGTLVGHMARANPQWRAFDGATQVLAIFSGPHGYVSPRWYETEPAVPTWNYAAIHVYGAARTVEDEAAARALLARTAARYEGTGTDAWTMAGLSEPYVAGMLRGLVAFEMPIARIEAKFKLSQNRPPVDRQRVVERLADSASPGDAALAALMRARSSADV